MDHAQHDPVDTHHLPTPPLDLDLQSNPSLPTQQTISDPIIPSANDQQPRDGDHPINNNNNNNNNTSNNNNNNNNITSSKSSSPRSTKRKLPDNDLQSSPNCRCDHPPTTTLPTRPDPSHMPRIVVHPSTANPASPILPTTTTTTTTTHTLLNTNHNTATTTSNSPLSYLSLGSSNLSISHLSQPFSAPPTHSHFDTSSNPQIISHHPLYPPPPSKTSPSHRSHLNPFMPCFKPPSTTRLSTPPPSSLRPPSKQATPHKKSRNLSPSPTRSISSSILQPSQLHCHSSQPPSPPLQASTLCTNSSSAHSSTAPPSTSPITHLSCRASSLPPSSPCKKRRKDSDVAAKSSTKAGLRASGLGPKLSRGFRTQSDCRRPSFPQSSLQPAGLLSSKPSITPPSGPNTVTTSCPKEKVGAQHLPEVVYQSRSSDDFTLPDPAPIYVQLIARHAINLPRVNPLGSALAVPSSKTNAYARSLKRMLPTCDPQLSPRFTTTPDIHLPSWSPPITRSSMAELEFVEVLKNAQLRHDIVFDDVLRFRPNLDGDRGERKRLIADRYWLAIAQELEKNCRCTAFLHRPSDRYILAMSPESDLRRVLPCVCSAGSVAGTLHKPGTIPLSRIPSRFPGLVDELRNILFSLVGPRSTALCQTHLNSSPSTPSSHSAHDLISSTLDPKTLCGHLEKRTLDLSYLANFLGLVLKGHCAPMRDSIVDGMVSLIAGVADQFTLKPDATNAAHDSLQKCEYVGLAGGLRMSFELLELMKLDIANHQLRTLRPLLLETALEFEIRYFREHLAKKPSVERTKKWFHEALNRVHTADPLSVALTPADKVGRVVQDGLLELVFNANITQNQQPWGLSPFLSFPPPSAAAGLANAVSRSLPALYSSRFHRQIWAPAPSPSQIPETLSMDIIRLQNLHSDISDLTLAYMLIMLFKQLVGHSNLRPGDVETIKAEIWVFMSESVMKMKHPERKTLPGIGLKKIDLPVWRRALEDVLLHLAARVETIRQRAKLGTTPESPVRPPSPELIKTVMTWMDTQVRTGSMFFQLAQKRLRQTFEAILAQDLVAVPQSLFSSDDPNNNNNNNNNNTITTTSTTTTATHQRYGIPAVLRTGRTTLVDSDDSLASGARSRAAAELAARMASALPRFSHATSAKKLPSVSTTTTFPPLHVSDMIGRNGLTELSSEVSIVAGRLAKLLNYHLRGYSGLYAKLP